MASRSAPLVPRRSYLRSRSVSLFIISVTILLVAGVSIWQIAATRSSRKLLVLEGNLNASRIAAAMVASEMRGHERLMSSFVSRADTISTVKDKQVAKGSALLQSLRAVDPTLESAAFVDRQGVLWASDPSDPNLNGRSFSLDEDIQQALGPGVHTSAVRNPPDSEGTDVVALSSVIAGEDGNPLGVLQVTVPLVAFRNLAGMVEIPNDGSIQIFDKQGNSVTGASGAKLPGSRIGQTGAYELGLPDRSGDRLAGFAVVRELGWTVVVEQSEKAALAPVLELTSRLSAMSALVIVVLFEAMRFVSQLMRRLSSEGERTLAILESIADGVVTVDERGLITSANHSIGELTGFSPARMIGHPYADSLKLHDAKGRPLEWFERPLGRAIAESISVSSVGFGLSLETSEGDKVGVAVSAAPILDREAKLHGAVAVFRDISHEQEVDQLKSSLVSMVSHELRTPLTMIQGFSELLLDRDLTLANSQEALRQINAAANRLGRLIDDLLSVSRIESGRMTILPEPVDLTEILEEVVRPFSDSRTIDRRVEGDLPQVMADRDKLVQVLTNLLSNASKYSQDDTIITVAAQSVDSTVEVAVADQGLGMTAEETAMLFEKFFRSDRPEVLRERGTGLGLYISKNLVELQGGRLWFESIPGKGTTFYFSLPAVIDTRMNEQEVV